jgi:cell division septal protein FtsQ
MIGHGNGSAGTKDAVVRKRLGWLFLVPLVCVLVLLHVFASHWKEKLTVDRISMKGLQAISTREILSLSAIPMKAKLYGLQLSDIQSNLMRHPFIREASVRRGLPGGIEIDIVERVPVASMNVGQLQFVDREGIVLPATATQKKFDVPVIVGIDGMKTERPGAPMMHKELFKALEVLEEALSIDSSVYHMISEVDMNHGGDIILNAVDAGVPITIGRDGIGKKFRLLETFWNRYVGSTEAENLKYVDLRFEDQVVVKWNRDPEPQQKKTAL